MGHRCCFGALGGRMSLGRWLRPGGGDLQLVEWVKVLEDTTNGIHYFLIDIWVTDVYIVAQTR